MTIEQMICTLSAAGDQLESAAAGNDWALVERIQKRRQALLGQLTEARPALTPEQQSELTRLRAQELRVIARAQERYGALNAALEQPPARAARRARRSPGQRMRRAYGATDSGRPH